MQQRQTTTKSDIKKPSFSFLATKSLEDITISQLTKKRVSTARHLSALPR